MTKSNDNKHIFKRNCQDLQRWHMEAIWSTRKDSQQLRATICIKIHGEIYEGIRNYETAIDSISSSNKWSNRKNQPEDRNISIALYQLLTEQLNRIVSCCGISIQWQKTCSNREDTIWVKLWKAFIKG